MNQAFFDIHTHFPQDNTEVCAIQNVRFGEVAPEIGRLFSFGLHPWYLTLETMPAAYLWLQEQSGHPRIAAVGEAGLDKVCNTPWPLQMDAFIRCIDTSENIRKPLIIHCVKAHQAVIDLKKRLKPRQPWIFHGFNRQEHIARQCLAAGCYLSFGAAILRPDSPVLQSLIHCPDERLFLETDNRHDISIQAVYQCAAALRRVGLEDLQRTIRGNFSLFPPV